MATVVPELVRLAEDLTLIRDLGPYETDRVYHRARSIEYMQDQGSVVSAWTDEELRAQVVLELATLESRISECRRRGMLG